MLPILAAAMLAAAPMPTPATENDDLRCAAFFFIAVDGAKNDAEKNGLTLGAVYFTGKLEGRNPGIDLNKTLSDYLATTNIDQINAERTRCAAEFGAFGQRLIDLGNKLGGK